MEKLNLHLLDRVETFMHFKIVFNTAFAKVMKIKDSQNFGVYSSIKIAIQWKCQDALNIKPTKNL
jgi:hypothetical protein